LKRSSRQEAYNKGSDLDFEESRLRILEMSGGKVEKPIRMPSEVKKHPWEYELHEHRRRKKLEKYLVFTSVLSIISFISVMFLVWWIFTKI
jgi:hypothetical protein